MQNREKINLIWFRNNLRVNDNHILVEACKSETKVVAIYCLDPRQFEVDEFGFKKTEYYRAKFLLETLENLQRNLEKLNISLLVYFAKPEDKISDLNTQFDIDNIYAQLEWTKEEALVSKNVQSVLSQSVKYHEFYDQFLYHPNDIPLAFNEIPQVFTNFRKIVQKQSKVRVLKIPKTLAESNRIKDSTPIPTIENLGFETTAIDHRTAFPFKGGETEALERLEYYFFETKKLGVYKKTRNGLVGKDYSSKFSAWLANGSISARTIYWQVKHYEKTIHKNDSTYWLIFELLWRDYFKYVSFKHGNSTFKREGILQKTYHWNTDQRLLRDWINGTTKEPFVNANMIELKNTGWMSNRGRQNVASYFAKDLMLDWRIGAAYFESMLIDYDVHSNYGNWMYVSGVGNDPRDRKFNINLQASRYDANHKYRNLWLQETLF
ncbi:DASH family cryptochrome [Ichthyenterobacterium sp. W332]|uniref:Cryptochrome DASH n=1 Tax=Microcosmobacter mediterraneus TaxID=3075607 RepID=A0ABU2YHF5_9FLAO|nr:DASH family cryptochrome [Ichthyenterobacterium sp. W332]MDT0557604.1 DASH family cryptochrome [Ichthyenterobacterium sp. W332]